ncbi:hypothetical protein V9T40_009177 [Parthenolecanium corni]|uniref:Ig-like domain-containing protein n=1 Tax=Parthenolecanium corni TaxID=536013 RepID=A0AAN9TPD4_9HEMI
MKKPVGEIICGEMSAVECPSMKRQSTKRPRQSLEAVVEKQTIDSLINNDIFREPWDDGITLGMYLTIDQVEPSDFGDYVCSASNTGDQITERTSQIARNDENSDIKDVFVLYEMCEADFVTQVLIPRLTHYQYSVEAHILENGVFVGTECQTRITNCRTVLVVVSSPDPDSLQDCKYFAQKLYIASKLGHKVKVICPIVQVNFPLFRCFNEGRVV